MPELPEVETTRRGLLPLEGKRVLRVVVRHPMLRWPVPQDLPELLQGRQLLGLKRRAKYILAEFEHGTLILHLGMSGRICLLSQDEAPAKHDHFDIGFEGGYILRLRDPRRFGAVLWTDQPVSSHVLIQSLGPEPLEAEFDAQWLYAHTRHKSVVIKNAIMDSHLVVGVGNIYASESLFRARIHPETPAGKLSLKQCERLVTEIKQTLTEALAAGGSSLRDFFGADGNPGYFQQEYFTYGRTAQPCKVCNTLIQNIRLGQRSTFYCPLCQKR